LHRIFIDAACTPADAQPPEPVLNIVIDIAAFEDLVDDLCGTGDADGPGPMPATRPDDPRWWRSETVDGVHVPRSAVLRAALIGHVRRVVINSAGVVVDVGRKRRLFTGAQRDVIMMLDNWCTFPGCTTPTRHCQADHSIDHQHGGTTATANGGPQCGRHNRLENRGYTVWRDPCGYWHTYRPDGTEIR
jgi:hypothetical protein